MSSRQRRSATRLDVCLKVVLAIYVTAAALMPLSHHDLACHFKSPTHCTTCIIGSSGETSESCHTLTSTVLADAGQAAGPLPAAVVSTTFSATAGRSPPARG